MKKYNCIIVLGATATGKTGLSVELAKKLNGEIINADSTQVYKELNIGTAKASIKEMQGIKHHLISFLNADEQYTVAEFKKQAQEVIEKLWGENKTPIIVGGTGFYIDSLINNYVYGNSVKNEHVREKYNNLTKEHGKEYVYNILKKLDPEAASILHANDSFRVIRALEIFETTGKTKSQLVKENQENNKLLNNTMQNTIKPLIIGLELDRDVLYERINQRFSIMKQAGLKQEVKGLYDKNYSANWQSMKSIGYKEYYELFNGVLTEQEVEEKIKQNTRNYAKRQITWFKRNKNVLWFNLLKNNSNEVIEKITTIYNS